MAAEDQSAIPSAARATLPVYGAAIFLSAALLFAVQPMFTKMVLPQLGGSPQVWSVAMVFFQAMLLAGYAYAHLITRRLPVRFAVPAHVGVLVVATFALPLAIASGWGRPPTSGEAFWLIGVFVASIGLPFFALAANGPLLQAWFARTDHPAAHDPYFLYATSNVGSFLALIAYPLAIEPLLPLGAQTRAWSLLFYVLIVLIALCGVVMLRSRSAAIEADNASAAEGAPSLRDKARWVALAAVPSGLLIAVTAHLSTDVAAAPLLWVVPLALYLATFVIVFQRRPLLRHRWMVDAQPVFIVALVVSLAFEVLYQIFVIMALNILAFFITALVCHGELVARRPPARHLTAFYLWMSFGGMIGGIGAGLIAPYVFSWVAEYPLLIVLAILCRPGRILDSSDRDRPWWIAVLVAALGVTIAGIGHQYGPGDTLFNIIVAVFLLLTVLVWRDPLKFATLIALVFVFVRLHDVGSANRQFVRSFFGVYKIVDKSDGEFRVLLHGTTEHGAQRIRDSDGNPVTGRPEPLTYYHALSPMAQSIEAVRNRKGAPIRMAVVGLGTGTLACHIKEGDALTFYEIDRIMVRIASELFSYRASCAPDSKIVLGDARLTLADAPDGLYDIIILDAFTSDAIPVHLITREAMAIYMRKLAPAGLAVIHVSNRHMELTSVVAGIAAVNGFVTLVNDSDRGEDDSNYKFSSTVVVVAREAADFASLASSSDWKVELPRAGQRVWTDDYSNVVGAILRQYRY